MNKPQKETHRKIDPRTAYTKNQIKRILLDFMKKKSFYKITVTEICKRAGINRGTFYLHYCDLFAVLDELEDEALYDEKALDFSQCSITEGPYQCPYKLCDKIHTHPEYGVIFFDDALTGHVIEKIARISKEKYIALLTKQSKLSAAQAEMIFYFQLNGCLAVNKKIFRNGSKGWEKSRDLIGGFIQGGLERYMK